jgi:hypothetical protein
MQFTAARPGEVALVPLYILVRGKRAEGNAIGCEKLIFGDYGQIENRWDGLAERKPPPDSERQRISLLANPPYALYQGTPWIKNSATVYASYWVTFRKISERPSLCI